MRPILISKFRPEVQGLTFRGIYGRKFPPQQIPFQHLTHINYAFANINKETGTVALSDTWADVEVSTSTLALFVLWIPQVPRPDDRFTMRVIVGMTRERICTDVSKPST
jgi:hypothetical protein